jgi:hypothetical protein
MEHSQLQQTRERMPTRIVCTHNGMCRMGGNPGGVWICTPSGTQLTESCCLFGAFVRALLPAVHLIFWAQIRYCTIRPASPDTLAAPVMPLHARNLANLQWWTPTQLKSYSQAIAFRCVRLHHHDQSLRVGCSRAIKLQMATPACNHRGVRASRPRATKQRQTVQSTPSLHACWHDTLRQLQQQCCVPVHTYASSATTAWTD